MQQVIVFAGTTEGRKLSEWLAGGGVDTLACVATEYGRQLVDERAHLSVHQGRMEPEEMKSLFKKEGLPLVLDVTHPYAVAVSQNIRKACEDVGCEYLRLIRPSLGGQAKDLVTVDSVEEAVDWLKETKGSVLVTTGSKELHKYTALPDYRERIYARVLATPEVVTHCTELGFSGSHLICMQGPFLKEMNFAMLKQTGASYLVTKESGKAGGFEEKLEAAAQAGVKVILIGRPQEQKGMSVKEGMDLLGRRFSLNTSGNRQKVTLVGIGMGVREHLTREACEAFEEADCILGAGRMLENFRSLGKPLFDAYAPEVMRAYIRDHQEYERIAVALSGDVGFYSGARRLIVALEEEGIQVELLPGISSVTYFCSRLRIPWEDIRLMSIHGRKGNLIAAVQGHFRTFTLLGGKDTVASLCQELMTYGLREVKLFVGERLRYPDERITVGTPEKLKNRIFDKLCVALIENPDYYAGVRASIPDEAFIRGQAPMTKSEIRSLSVAKLRLCRDSIVYDIGAGTGSVSIEIAIQAWEGTVWAIEKKESAACLIQENCLKFGTPNVTVVKGEAPEVLKDLPAPTHAFIGGSSGNLKEILELLLQKNPNIFIVMNAITLETIGEAVRCLKELPFCETEILQVQVAKAKAVGDYQLMMGQNPVYLFSCRGNGEAQKSLGRSESEQ